MKILFRSLMLMIAVFGACSGSAFVTKDNVRYASCYDCVSDADYIELAQQHHYYFGSPNLMIVVDANPSSIIGDVTAGSIRQIRKTVQRRMDFSNPNEPMFIEEVSFSLEPVDLAFQTAYSNYISQLSSMSTNDYTMFTRNVIEVTLDTSTTNITWLNSSNFASTYQGAINQAVGNASFDPFFFVDKSLIVRVNTNDGYAVTLIQKPDNSYQWDVLYTTQLGSDNLVTVTGSSISPTVAYDDFFVCAKSVQYVFCRQTDSSGNILAGFYRTSSAKEDEWIRDPRIPPQCTVGNCRSNPPQGIDPEL